MIVIPLVAIHALNGNKPNAFDIFRIIGLLNVFPWNIQRGFLYPEPIGIAWTISAEFWLGIIYFPLTYLLRRRLWLLASIGLPTAMFLLLYLNVHSPDFMNVHYHKATELVSFAFIRCLVGFIIGSVVFFFTMYNKKYHNINEIASTIVQIIIILILLYGKNGYLKQYEYISPVLFGLFIYFIAQEKGCFYKLFDNKFGVFMGSISYPLYLFHPIIVNLTQNGMFIKDFGLYLFVCIIASYILHVVIEKPFIRFGKQI